MKVLHLSYADIAGGAARAAFRLHRALRGEGVNSVMAVNEASAHDWTVQGPSGKGARISAKLRPHVGAQLARAQKSANPVLHSTAVLPGGIARRLGQSGADLVNLHWVNGEMCSVAELGRLSLPVVWTMHDMWPFAGSEHYATDFRWRDGYRRDNRAAGEGGFDLDRWTWARKRRHWTRPFHLVAPSHWLADCARSSALLADWPVHVIPNPIDLNQWKPLDRGLARQILGLPLNRRLVLFGAMGGTADPRKGSDLLMAALSRLSQTPEGTMTDLVIFGQSCPENPADLGFPVHYAGHLHDEVALRLLYCACDLFVLPSRQDNLPNTGVEAQACGRPVIGFDIGGLPDIALHMKTGYLARPFDVDDLARGIAWCIAEEHRCLQLSAAARAHAETTFAAPLIAARYSALYADILERKQA